MGAVQGKSEIRHRAFAIEVGLVAVIVSAAAALLAGPALGAPAAFNATSGNGGRVFFETTDPLLAGEPGDGTNDVFQRFGGATTVVTPGRAPPASPVSRPTARASSSRAPTASRPPTATTRPTSTRTTTEP